MVDFNNIESLYKSHSETQEVAPPINAWQKIEASLNAKQLNRKVMWIWFSGIAASVMAIFYISSLIWFMDEPATKLRMAESNESNRNLEITQEPATIVVNPHKSGSSTPLKKNLLADATNHKFQQENTSIPASRDDVTVQNIKSNIQLANNYLNIDNVNVKPLQKVHRPINWMDLYKVESNINENTKSTNHFTRKVEIGGVYSPVYAFRQASNPATESTTMMAEAAPSEKGLVYGGGGIRVNVLVSKNLSVESGVRFSRLGQKINAQPVVESFMEPSSSSVQSDYQLNRIPLNNSMGSISTRSNDSKRENDLHHFSSNQNYHVKLSNADSYAIGAVEQNIDYLEVPISLRFYLINKGISVSLSAGLSTNWLVSNNVYLMDESSKEKIGETSGLSAVTISSNGGLALTVPLSKRLSFQMEPRVNYFLSDINKEFAGSFKPYSFGVYTGIQYSIGK